jgi:hypothetical protein
MQRTLPQGSALAALDYYAFGEWPGAIPCTSCAETGNFSGRDVDGDWLDCDECEGRGFNPVAVLRQPLRPDR